MNDEYYLFLLGVGDKKVVHGYAKAGGILLVDKFGDLAGLTGFSFPEKVIGFYDSVEEAENWLRWFTKRDILVI